VFIVVLVYFVIDSVRKLLDATVVHTSHIVFRIVKRKSLRWDGHVARVWGITNT